MTNRLPGPAPMIGLMLAAILVVWLGILGPLDLRVLFDRLSGLVGGVDWKAVAATSIVTIGLVVVGIILVRRTSTTEAAAQVAGQSPLPAVEPRAVFSPDDWKQFRKSFRLVIGLVGAISVLHFGAAASVLPYVWVDDEHANCGARLVLDRAVGEMMVVLFYILLALLGLAFIAFVDLARLQFPKLQVLVPPEVLAGKLGSPVLKSSLVPLSLAVLALVGILIDDLRFLRNPPVVPSDKDALALCAHPKETAKWSYKRFDFE